MARYTLADARARALKPRDSWWTVFLVDPIATRLALFTANHTPLTPNQLSTLSLGVGLGASLLYYDGTRTALVAGALLYHLSFIIDCVDGKVARLKGTGSPLGEWLDYVFDRIRVFVAGIALMAGQYRLTGDATFLYLAAVVVFLDMLRYINALKSSKITGSIERPTAASGSQRFGRVRATLAGRRIRPHLFSGVEFQMFVFILGPLTGQIIAVTVASSVVLLIFEVAALSALRTVIRHGTQR